MAVTSANRHGHPTAGHGRRGRCLAGRPVDLVVDGGRLADRASTVVDATSWPFVVLREGPIAGAEVLEIAADARRSTASEG